MKKIFFLAFIMLSIVINVYNVNASDNSMAKIGNQFFNSLEEAIAVANSTDTITLTSDVTLGDTLKINKTVNINLNNHDIKADEKVFSVQGGSLNLSGNGRVVETKPYYGAIVLKGSSDPNKVNYSTVSIDSGITLEGWSGIFIDHYNNSGYGILINMNGNINAINDINGGSGAGIYVNGNIKHEDNAPIINLGNTTKITSSGNGIYAAGYATYNINGAYISGKESGLGIKSGVFNILDGTIIGSGEDKTPASGNNNGINPSGAAIQIESNPNYKGNIQINIKNGIIKSNNSNAIYEYTVSNSQTKVKSINITGGTYTSGNNKADLELSNSFKNTHQGFIAGGTYSSDPTDYLKNGYKVVKNSNSSYEVTVNTISVFSNNTESNNSSFILLLILLIPLGTFIYLNRNKISNLIN